MKRLIIDRFEGKFAVCETEDGSMVNILKTSLPDKVIEGSCIVKLENETYTMDEEEYKKRRENIKKLMDELFE